MVGRINELARIPPEEQQTWKEEFVLRRRFTGGLGRTFKYFLRFQ
jgi:hypothetical protein